MPHPLRSRLLLAAAAIAVIVAACGGGADADADAVASLDDVTTGSATSVTTPLAAGDALLEFSQCMRDEGVDIPDIGLDPGGGPDLTDPAFQAIDVESAQFTDALDACQPILTRVEAFGFAFDPEFQARLRDQLLGFSQCMRDNGVEDFPDPSNSLRPFPPETVEMLQDPGIADAVEECSRAAFAGLPLPGNRG